MIRLFQTHEIRSQHDLAGYWTFEVPGHALRKVLVPSVWETYPGFENYRGEAVYSTEITCGGHIRLVMEGVSHTADVYLDGVKIAHHYNAYTAFSAVIPDLPEGRHRLEIHVSNAFSADSALHVENDYYSYGGISRAVYYEELPDVWIENMHLTPRKESDDWLLGVEAVIRNISGQPKTVCLADSLGMEEYDDSHESVLVPAHSSVTISYDVICPDAATYEPDTPVLYSYHLMLGAADLSSDEFGPVYTDDLIDRVGFRTLAIRDGVLLYNGHPFRIHGFNRHEDHPLFGCALPAAAMEHDLALVKDLGGNAIRTSHYPNDPLFLDLCDEQGIMVWEENHARGLSEAQMRNPHFEEQCEACIREMVRDHYNHPSIIIWGLLNECASETEYGRSCYEKQFTLLKSLDHSRPTSFASCKHYKDLCMDLPDIISYNIYPDWYLDLTAEEYLNKLYDWVQTTAGAGKPFLITEIGAGAIYGYRHPSHDKWTEEFQQDALRDQISAIQDDPRVLGLFIWQFADCRVTRGYFKSRPRSMNNKGIVDEYRRPKLAYETVKEFYHQF